MSYTKVNKPTGSTYTAVSKPTGSIYTTISKPTGSTYTAISKPTGSTYTVVDKPSDVEDIDAGETQGLLIPLTASFGKRIQTAWTKISKPT